MSQQTTARQIIELAAYFADSLKLSVCTKCNAAVFTRGGMEPSPLCDPCAHAMCNHARALAAALLRVAEILEPKLADALAHPSRADDYLNHTLTVAFDEARELAALLGKDVSQ